MPLPTHNIVLPAPVSVPKKDDGARELQKQEQQLRFSITHLTELPCSLSRINMIVRTVVAVLLPSPSVGGHMDLTHDALASMSVPPDLESVLIPRLDPKEVSAVFTVPLEAFLSETYNPEYLFPPSPTSEKWHTGNLVNWLGRDRYMHEFMAPVWAHRVATAGSKRATRAGYNDKLLTAEEEATLRREGLKKQQGEEGVEENILIHYRIWGMTAKILLDAARIAYAREPDFDCLQEKGDEHMIATLWDRGMLRGDRQHGEEFVVREVLRKGNL